MYGSGTGYNVLTDGSRYGGMTDLGMSRASPMPQEQQHMMSMEQKDMMMEMARKKMSSTYIVAIVALVIAIVAVVALITMALVWYFVQSPSTDNTESRWNLVQGTSSATSQDFTASSGDMYIANITSGSFTLTVKKPSSPKSGEMFVIDNTRNSSSISILAGDGVTFTDNVGAKSVAARMSAFYIWTSSASFERVI